MKKLIVTSIFVSIIFSLMAQENRNYSAMILSLNGEGTISRDAEKLVLDLPQRFMPGDILTVRNGNAIVMLFSGEEVPLKAVSNYTVPEEESSKPSALYKMANDEKSDQSLLAQSGAAYSIRGKSNVFPMKSKVLNKKNIRLKFHFEESTELSLNFKLIDSQSQKVLFEKEGISDTVISLAHVNMLEGKSYYWTLNNTPSGKPEMGTIVLPTSDTTQSFLLIELGKSHYENLNTISALYNDKYYFDAFSFIEKCIQEYPDYAIYQELMKNLLLE